MKRHCWEDVIDAATLRRSARYDRKPFNGKSPALLLIDLYNFAYDGGNRPLDELDKEHAGAFGEYAWNAIEPTKRLIAASRAVGIPIIYLTRKVDTHGVVSTRRSFRDLASDAYDIWRDFTPEPGDLVLYKTRASGFFATPLAIHLHQMNVKSLIVCGESTSGCVRSTVHDAFAHGFDTAVAEECVYDRSPVSHKVNLFDMHQKYAEVMHVEEVLAYLGMQPGLRSASGF
jgi:nicotinamidase-related amidase